MTSEEQLYLAADVFQAEALLGVDEDAISEVIRGQNIKLLAIRPVIVIPIAGAVAVLALFSAREKVPRGPTARDCSNWHRRSGTC